MFDKQKYLELFGKNSIIKALQYLSDEMPEKLFKFFSLETLKDEIKLKTLEEDKVWVELFKNQNDPFEMINLDINEETVKSKYNKDGELIIDEKTLTSSYQKHMDYYKKTIKTASFCDVMETNISMWAYYTNNHQGFCCEYETISKDVDKMMPLRPVLYENKMAKVKSSFAEKLAISGLNTLLMDNKEIKMQIFNNLEYIKLLASCKDLSWEHEHEYRAFLFGDNNDKGQAVKSCELNLKLKAIYAGIKCSVKNKERLKSIAKKLNIEFYEMEISTKNYSFKKILG